jgi:hypothetical protein
MPNHISSSSVIGGSGYVVIMRVLKQLLIVLAVSNFATAAAESSYFEVRIDAVNAFSQPNLATPGLPLLGIQLGFDFDSSSGGFGTRISANYMVLLSTRVAVDVYRRLPLDAEGRNVYLGLGGALFNDFFNAASASDLHALFGLVLPLTPTIHLTLEVVPGVVIAGQRGIGCCAPPPPSEE